MRVILVVLCLLGAQSAIAQNVVHCSPAQDVIVRAALDHAKSLAITAASAVGDTPDYARWFGTYSDRNAETARATLKSVVRAIRAGGVSLQCDTLRDQGCGNDEYAWVYADKPYHIYLCPSFFDMPVLASLRPGTRASDNGTREGTLIHELSHFRSAGGTEDHCYTRRDCMGMALQEPDLAIENADSYQYFTEDVIYYASQPVIGKASP
ncbi:M35 family metallo-endopeptidase [Yoonia vestfoldensis]|uniref:Probable protease n=1 Tax=Yoonia vestfoldensis SKA53 TaxID=314232 RepID=A3V8N1_9RHOB|nr:M35 family metallo-endopeptidase [Yoonia vestfoldensis]EAQ05462.1 probable protease precursor [Yoonia vestfoldensis SKA53]